MIERFYGPAYSALSELRDVERACRRFSFCGLFGGARLTVVPSLFGEDFLRLKLKVPVPHRDTGETIVLEFTEQVAGEAVPDLLQGGLVRRVRAMLCKVAEHEALEAVLVDDVRVFDPHAGEEGGP